MISRGREGGTRQVKPVKPSARSLASWQLRVSLGQEGARETVIRQRPRRGWVEGGHLGALLDLTGSSSQGAR